MIDEHAAHQMRGDADEVRAILPGHASGVDQPNERFVDQRRRLQSVTSTLAIHVRASESSQLCLDKRQQALECALVAFAPRPEQLSDALMDVQVPLVTRFGFRFHLPCLTRRSGSSPGGFDPDLQAAKSLFSELQ
jgi:hypothetical protein